MSQPGARSLVVAIVLSAFSLLGLGRPPTCVICTFDFSDPTDVFSLPLELEEVSGLASLDATTLLAHDDEVGIIYQIDLESERVEPFYTLREEGGVLRGDFEGIAVGDHSVFLITSDGILFSVAKSGSADGREVKVVDTGVGDHCEVEGVDFDAPSGELFIACKKLQSDAYDVGLLVFRWSVKERALREPPISITKKVMKNAIGEKRFHASGIQIDENTGHLILVSAQDQFILEITRQGGLVAARRLPEREHPQAEGIGLLPGGRLIIADEGKRKGGTIAIYAD